MTTSTMLYRLTKRSIPNRRSLMNLFRRSSSVWSADKVVQSPYPNSCTSLTKTTVENIWENLDKWADKTAVVDGFTGQSYTYHQLQKSSRILAARLRREYGIRDGDVVCVMLPNIADTPVAMLAALQAGAIVTTANPFYTPYEVARQLTLSGAKLAIGTNNTVKVLQEALTLNKTEQIPIITVHIPNESVPDGTASFRSLIEGDVDTSVVNESKRSAEDIAFLPYSSGTTGLPKGVELVHRNIVANCTQLNDPILKHHQDTTGNYQEVVLGVLPLFHIYGLTVLMMHKLSIGAKLVLLPQFHVDSFAGVMEKYPISLIYAAPPLVLFLASHPSITSRHLASVELVMSGAAPLPVADVHNLIKKAESPRLEFLQGYGLTETSPMVSMTARGCSNYERVGYAMPDTQLRILSDKGDNLGPDEVGELLVKGPQVMRGYKDNEQATRDVLTEDGWFRTGDLASIDREGSLRIHDRLKELIKVKGFQVPPAELESVLKEHPEVLDAAVVGVPHAATGEVPKAFVVLRGGAQSTSEQIRDFVTQRVAKYKKLSDVQFVDSLPKNPSGKILRRVLKEKYC